MKKQQGFTLIELMIVVAIIGVLSALAIPAYKSYVTKSEATTAVSVARGLLTNIDMFIQEKDRFPASATADDLVELGASTDMSALGTIAITADKTNLKEGVVTFTLIAPATLATKIITYTKTGNGWKCTQNTGVELKSCAKKA
ncbi:prepilin-type cleavage/methylation domain-containing protein [Photobacterium phosphoreum]|uniref:pilin n=1 Tax=Photobacterium phosphoreum TaxID=659 RepID=UPI000D15A10E|nr:pilin [Photobacterium phosphoreum]PSU69545.1 prepilin-type cleavage/methylation domain-containing protein [Photobacterium phosphoreum]